MKKRLRKVLSIALALFTIIGAMPVASLLAPVEVDAAVTTYSIGISSVEGTNFGNGDVKVNVTFKDDSDQSIESPIFYINAQMPNLTQTNIAVPNGATNATVQVILNGAFNLDAASILLGDQQQVTNLSDLTGQNHLQFPITGADSLSMSFTVSGNNGGATGPVYSVKLAAAESANFNFFQ